MYSTIKAIYQFHCRRTGWYAWRWWCEIKNKFTSWAQIINIVQVRELATTISPHSCLAQQCSQYTATAFAVVMKLMKSKNSSLFLPPNVCCAQTFKTRSHNQWEDLFSSRHHRKTQDSPDATFNQFLRFNCPITQFRITLISQLVPKWFPTFHVVSVSLTIYWTNLEYQWMEKMLRITTAETIQKAGHICCCTCFNMYFTLSFQWIYKRNGTAQSVQMYK